MISNMIFPRALVLGMASFFAFSACDPVPSKELTPEQKITDMLWLYSQFDENYAPLEYKMEKFGFDYQTIKAVYLKAAESTKSNGEFYLLMNHFVAQFKDPHTTTHFYHGGLPGRVSIAFLGFAGHRQGSNFVVTELLPSYDQKTSSFPIEIGDEISELDGRPLTEIIQQDLVPFADIGYEESNLTFHMNRIFTRVSTSEVFPVTPDGQLRMNSEVTVLKQKVSSKDCESVEKEKKHSCKTQLKKKSYNKFIIPWIYKDIYEFNVEQSQATRSTDKKQEQTLQFKNLSQPFPVLLGLSGFDGALKSPQELVKRWSRSFSKSHFMDSFYFPNDVQSWSAQLMKSENDETSSIDELNRPHSILMRNRFIPSSARFITSKNATFPTYITEEKIPSTGGNKRSETKLVATLFLNTFSPEQSHEEVVQEFKNTLETLRFYRINDLIIDLINNGGGSLSLGMELAQNLSAQKIDMPSLQLRISESWLNEFELKTLSAPSDSEREIAFRVFEQLEKEYKEGKRLSSPIGAEILIPFQLRPNLNLKENLNIVLLTNEMCASMCDIFAGILQDNQMATIVGSRTMGAGGNVVNHFQAPNSHMHIRQTESLVVRSNAEKSYIENNGVQPDYPMNVSKTSGSKYQSIREAAIKLLTERKSKTGKRKRSSARTLTRNFAVSHLPSFE